MSSAVRLGLETIGAPDSETGWLKGRQSRCPPRFREAPQLGRPPWERIDRAERQTPAGRIRRRLRQAAIRVEQFTEFPKSLIVLV